MTAFARVAFERVVNRTNTVRGKTLTNYGTVSLRASLLTSRTRALLHVGNAGGPIDGAQNGSAGGTSGRVVAVCIGRHTQGGI